MKNRGAVLRNVPRGQGNITAIIPIKEDDVWARRGFGVLTAALFLVVLGGMYFSKADAQYEKTTRKEATAEKAVNYEDIRKGH